MNKDVIYIDVEDDITAIIGKVKASSEKIVAIVPPKRIGVLQSAVNLRLLDRMAKADKKHLVLITNNPALIALSASAKIPVAKNLQSKPEIAEIPALSIDDGDDIIDGSELSIGDHAKSVNAAESTRVAVKPSRPSRNDALETLAIDDEVIEVDAPAIAGTPRAAAAAKAAKSKSKVKVPNFGTFRKKLFLVIIAIVLLIAGLVWAFVFAPSARVIITAGTTPAPVSATVKLGGTAATDAKAGVIRSEAQQIKKDATVEFTATGTKQVGEKATGTMDITRAGVSDTAATIPAGTQFSGGGYTFVTTQDAVVPASKIVGSSLNPGTAEDVPVAAAEVGAQYNVAPRSYTSSLGSYTGQGSQMAGGSSKEVKVVSDEDIERAKGQLIGQSTDAVKKQVKALFKNGEVVIDSSFTADAGAQVSTPASGAEAADGKATLAVPMTYTIYGFPKADLETYLNATMKSQLDNDKTQRVYETGAAKAGLSNFRKAEDGTMTVSISADGKIGPKIDETVVKEEVKGKITGDVQLALQDIEGIKDVDVQFSYFWVRKVPTNLDKITIEFKLENE